MQGYVAFFERAEVLRLLSMSSCLFYLVDDQQIFEGSIMDEFSNGDIRNQAHFPL